MNPDPTSLDRLHDLVLPPPVPWWPPAPVWYIVLGLLALVLIKGAYRVLAHWQRNRYRREALHELVHQEQRLRDPAQRAIVLTEIAELLKRTAITAFPREQVAALSGAAWCAFLDRTAPAYTSSSEPLTVGACAALAEGAAYNPRNFDKVPEAPPDVVIRAVRHWLAHHHLEPAGGGRRYD